MSFCIYQTRVIRPVSLQAIQKAQTKLDIQLGSISDQTEHSADQTRPRLTMCTQLHKTGTHTHTRARTLFISNNLFIFKVQ